MNAMLPAALSVIALAVAPGPVTTKKATHTKSKRVAKSKGKVVTFAPAPEKSLGKAPTAQPKAVDRLLQAAAPPRMTKAKLSKATDLEIHEMNWAFLTPSAAKRNGRASLSFYKPHMISGYSSRAVFYERCSGMTKAGDTPCKEGVAMVGVHADKAGLFAVNCTLQAATGDVGDWIIDTKAGQARVRAKVGWNEVAFVIQADKAGNYSATLRGEARAWALSSCSVNTVG